MRSRSVFLEDGRRLYNIGALAPDALWSSVSADFDRLLGSFTLDEVHGITAAPLRLMTSEPSVDLSALSAAAVIPSEARAERPRSRGPGHSERSEPPGERSRGIAIVPSEGSLDGEDRDSSTTAPDGASARNDNLMDEAVEPNDRHTEAADVALADDTASLDPEHPINARLRDNGIGLVPRVIMVATQAKFASVGCAAIESVFRVPKEDLPASRLRGRVLDASGRPAGNVRVVAVRISDILACSVEARSNAKGEFAIGPLTRGTYSVWVEGTGAERSMVAEREVLSGRDEDVGDVRAR